MNYYIAKSDELYHYGVKGMKWGIRKQRETLGRQRLASDAHYKEQRRARIKKAAKIGAAVVGTALIAYGGYKLRGAAINSLTKKSISTGKMFVSAYWAGMDTSANIANNADKIKLRGGSKELYKFNVNLSRNTEKTARRYLDEGLNELSKAKNRSYSRKEVSKEMGRIAKQKAKLIVKSPGGTIDRATYRLRRSSSLYALGRRPR